MNIAVVSFGISYLTLDNIEIIFGPMETFCTEPMTTLNIAKPLLFPCCESFMDLSDVAKLRYPATMADRAWNIPAWSRFRDMVRRHDYSMCSTCPRYRMKEMFFMTAEQARSTYGDGLYDYLTGKSDTAPPPHTVILSYDSSCNLTCSTCRPPVPYASPEKTETDYMAIYHNAALKIIPMAKRVVIAGDGEIGISRYYMDAMSHVSDGTSITIMSNGTLMNEDFWGRVQETGRMGQIDQVNISADGTTGPVYEATRRGGKFDRFMDNMALLSEMKRQCEFRTKLCYTVSTANLSDYENAPRFARTLGFDELYMSIAVTWERLSRGSLYHSENIISDPGTRSLVERNIESIMRSYGHA